MEQKQKLEESVRKRLAAEERAFNVVLRLIEELVVTEEYLADAVRIVNLRHHSEVKKGRKCFI